MLMGGTISMQTKLEEGTTFTISFPLYKGEELNTDTPQQTDYQVRENTVTKRILVVEDEFQNFEITSLFLIPNYCCVHARNGKEALQLLMQEHFDLILMDINLGSGMNGIEILKEVRNLPTIKSIPVIALTAFAMKGDIQEFLNNGFNQVLTKPFTRNMLNYTVKKYIGMK
jgi:CheY-like chemotaxis protein